MHFIKFIENPYFQTSLFQWNGKYIVKFEWEQLEQTFKIPEYEVQNIQEIESGLTAEFLEKVKHRFIEMHQEWFQIFD